MDNISDYKLLTPDVKDQNSNSSNPMQNAVNNALRELKKKKLSYEEWCIKKDIENKLKNKLIKETKRDLHHELAHTLEEALQRKRNGDMLVSEWIRQKKKEYRRSKSLRKKEQNYKKNFEKVKAKTNEKAFCEWLKNNLK